ncbi:MAG: response regulator transcription factor [Saprospiraceae bacterium]|nr:response regulator transcription factor [Saprospiraceae bacterium]
MHVLLIEDEPKMAKALQQGFADNMVQMDCAYDGLTGHAMAAENKYSVIISDIILPEMNGLEVLRQLRSEGNTTPVLLLSALGQTDDKVTGFELGADDYLTKPFEFRELLLRVRALARRRTEQPGPTVDMLHYADLTMNLASKELFRQGKRIMLTPREYALMEYFMNNPERVISKNEITERVWNLDFDTGTNVIEVYVNFLRKKIEKDFDKKLIHTLFKTGYILREEAM